LQHCTQLLIYRLLSKFHLSHVKRANTCDTISRMNNSRRLALCASENDVDHLYCTRYRSNFLYHSHNETSDQLWHVLILHYLEIVHDHFVWLDRTRSIQQNEWAQVVWQSGKLDLTFLAVESAVESAPFCFDVDKSCR
jgi:hypothetical protein